MIIRTLGPSYPDNVDQFRDDGTKIEALQGCPRQEYLDGLFLKTSSIDAEPTDASGVDETILFDTGLPTADYKPVISLDQPNVASRHILDKRIVYHANSERTKSHRHQASVIAHKKCPMESLTSLWFKPADTPPVVVAD